MKHHTITQTLRGISLLALAGFMLTGCNGAERQARTMMPPMVTPQAYTEPEQRYENPGSLFSDSGQQYLFSDNRARNVGDLLVIKVVETSRGEHNVDTTAERTNSHQLQVGAAFGRSSMNPLGGIGVDPLLSANTKSTNEATGETSRESKLTTTVGARVVQVLPNGLMQVEGAREIRVNNETEYMIVTGLVRQRDVGVDNSVLSTEMSDMNIEYWGSGALADKQKAGWLTRLLDAIWPF